MHYKKGLWLFLFVSVTLAGATALGRCVTATRPNIQADGGAPLPPPIPWASANTLAIPS